MNAPVVTMGGEALEGGRTDSNTVIIGQREQGYGGSIHLQAYCKKQGLPFHEIAKPYGSKFLRRAHEFLCYVEDVQVVGDGFLVMPGGGIATRGLTCSNYYRAVEVKLSQVEPSGNTERIPEAILCWGGDNWGHWFFQFLMRLTLVMGPQFSSIPVLVSSAVPRRFLEWLPLLGFSHVIQADEWVTVDRLWVPSVITYRGHYEDYNCYVSASAVHTMRRRMTAPEGRWKKNVFVSRRGASWRKILNETELISALGDDWEVIEMENMGVDEQIAAISHAENIIMSAGASGPITMLAPKGCRIIELIQPKLVGTFGPASWAYIVGQKYTRIDGEPVVEAKGVRKEIDWDYTIDVGKVMQAVRGGVILTEVA